MDVVPLICFAYALLASHCCCSVIHSCPTLCDPLYYSTPDSPVLHCLGSLLKLMPIGSMVPSNHLILCHPLLLLPSVSPSIGVFSNELALCIKWPKYCSFSISPFSEYSGLISFRIDLFDLLALLGTLKSLLQCRNSKASNLLFSAFFVVQLSHPYMTIRKTIALTRQTFVSKMMSLLFNMLSRFVIAFLPRSKCLLISWLKSPSTLILEPKKMKSDSFHFSPSVCHEVMRCHLCFLNVEF